MVEKTEAANALVLAENLLVLNIVDEKTLLLAKVSGAGELRVQLSTHPLFGSFVKEQVVSRRIWICLINCTPTFYWLASPLSIVRK